MTLAEGSQGASYTVSSINTEDEELESFLFTLGCYSGETVTLVSVVGKSFTVSIRDGRYNMDDNLAKAIVVA